MSPPPKIRIVQGTLPTKCWLLKSGLFILFGSYVYLPHYFMWLKHRNLIPVNEKLQQDCETRGCINPQHYHLVTGSEKYCISLQELIENDTKIDAAIVNMILHEDFVTEW